MKRLLLLFLCLLMGSLCCCSRALTPVFTQDEGYKPQYSYTQGTHQYIDAAGNLYLWGIDYNNFFPDKNRPGPQLAQGSLMLYNNVPRLTATQTLSAYFAQKAATKDGNLLCWGVGTGEYLETPQIIRTAIQAYYGNLYLTQAGELYGCYNYMAIGQDPPYGQEDTFLLDGVVDCCGCINERLALKSDGSVWRFEINSASLEILAKPAKLTENVARMLYDKYSNTVLFLKSDGGLWAYGDNEFGQCGNGEHGDFERSSSFDCTVTEPYKVMAGVKDAWVCGDTCYALTEEGALYGWGLNDYDVLLTGDTPTSALSGVRSLRTAPSVVLDSVKQLYPSSTGCLVIREDDSLWSWGVGNRGTLGNGVKTSGEDLDYFSLGLEIARQPLMCEPQKILEDVKRVYGVTENMLVFAEKKDGSLWYWGYDEIITDENGDWDTDSKVRGFYSRHEIIATPQPFDISTFHQGLGSKSK